MLELDGNTGVSLLQDNTVTTDKIAAGAITADKFADGALLENSPNGIGYAAGAGGSVTQTTSKTTSVTLNKPTGRIIMDPASLAANTTVSFNFINSIIGWNAVLVVSLVNGTATTGGYLVTTSCGGGVAVVSLRNVSGTTLAEAVQLNFAVIKGAAI